MARGQEHTESLEQGVRRFIRENHLVSDRRQLPVAVSGGPDSVCLLHVLVKLREELKVELHVAHLDHQLRGAESEADARYVAHLARQLGIPATIEARDVKVYQLQRHVSLEEAAREVRYNFLAQVAKSIGADRVAVGHTADDHIETILMHLIRGTGTRGLRGLQPSSRWHSPDSSLTVIRPLLAISRQETADYCRDRQLMPVMDASNLSLSPLRNRIRHQLLPLLRGYNPRVAEALLRTARIAADELAFLDEDGARLWAAVARRQGDTIILDRAGFLGLPPVRQRHLLRMAIEKLLGSLKDIETRHIEAIMAALTKPAGKRLDLPGGLVFAIEYHRYLLGPDPSALSPFPVLENDLVLKVPGETFFPGWYVKTAIIDSSVVKEKPAGASAYSATTAPPPFGKAEEPAGAGPVFTAYLDLDRVGGEVVVRSRHPGDRFQPLGMSQSKRLGEFMIDARIPRGWRERVPVVCSPCHILWVVGGRIDDRVKVTENTREVLYLEFKLVSILGKESKICYTGH